MLSVVASRAVDAYQCHGRDRGDPWRDSSNSHHPRTKAHLRREGKGGGHSHSNCESRRREGRKDGAYTVHRHQTDPACRVWDVLGPLITWDLVAPTTRRLELVPLYVYKDIASMRVRRFIMCAWCIILYPRHAVFQSDHPRKSQEGHTQQDDAVHDCVRAAQFNFARYKNNISLSDVMIRSDRQRRRIITCSCLFGLRSLVGQDSVSYGTQRVASIWR